MTSFKRLPERTRRHLREFPLRWLLEFAYQNLDRLTDEEWDELARQFLGLLGKLDAPMALASSARPTSSSQPLRQIIPSRPKLKELQLELAKGLGKLRNYEEWRLPKARRYLQRHRSGVDMRYLGSLEEQFLQTAADLIEEMMNRDRVRFCADVNCGRPFAPVGSQDYHTRQCSQRVRNETFRSKPGKKAR